MTKARLDMVETVWNSYEVRNYPKNFEEILKNKYKGNPYAMLEDYPDMQIILSEPCFDFIKTDYEKTQVDY